ncbi:interleukin-12 receptor subunit beta-2 [Notolabrus celidotus]|uniref:interleukin-12 receptor subunit beta-2 n=1 Tax=Notolabrus celidotus TaxID=1203425 RepID=UPI0014901EAB|nr:interleukin-12 receptor subunit beta-2 [Notolabrus celidotus]
MSRIWSIFTAVTVLAVQLCAGQSSCTIWSTTGSVAQRGSSFKVYCTFSCKSLGKIRSNNPPTPQKHEKLNSTTIFHNVVNITRSIRTFSCMSSCPHDGEPCGMDIRSGYLPVQPKIMNCTYNVRNDESGVVFCTWNTQDTYLSNTSVLWVKTVSGNHTAGPMQYKVSKKRTDTPSTDFTVSKSVQMISVWVQVRNDLGNATSAPVSYTLRDIAMPSAPVLGQPECSSRSCDIKVEHLVKTEHLEIQYKTEAQRWMSSPDSVVQMSQDQALSMSSLEPCRLYHFRARSKFSSGHWSEWSATVSAWSQEEAPAKELDVWYAEASSDATSLQVYWKEPNISIARGKIIQYKVSVYNQRSKTLVFNTSVGADARNYTVPFCANCEVKVWAYNSIGPSPPANITTKHTKAKPPQDVHVTADNHSVAISWRKPVTAPEQAEYIVEWYREGYKLEELRWVRLGKKNNQFVITGLKPAECYEGAVYVSYKDGSAAETSFTGVFLELVPAAGPSVQENVDGDKVKVTWTEIPRGQRGGCITEYTICLENSSRHQRNYSVQASQRTHTIPGLSPGVYSIWMTASTAKGEGPAGQTIKFYIQEDAHLFFVLVCVAVAVIILLLLCLWQSSAVKKRFKGLFQCLMLDAVLDPANSKWAKECTQEKNKMKLQLPENAYSVTAEEEEPILVDVEELPKKSSDICSPSDDSSHLSSETSLSPLTEQTTLPYPLTTYIKSLSHDSDSSEHTNTSMDTNSTVDYISSHGPGDMDEEFPEMVGFFPSHNIFIEPMECGGKLTLDAVKFNCTDLF